MDAADKADKMALEREKMKAENEREGLKLGLKAQYDQGKLKADQEREGLRIGVQVAQSKAQLAHDRHIKNIDHDNTQALQTADHAHQASQKPAPTKKESKK